MKKIRCILTAVIILGIIACADSPMGMGLPIDLEAPILTIEDILLNDGRRIPENPDEILDTGNKLILGPSIVFGPGALIRGKAVDNFGVAEVQVVEIRDGEPTGPVWSTKEHGKVSARDPYGYQDWEITLPIKDPKNPESTGLETGERVIQFTAFDEASLKGSIKNIASGTVKELSLLVDMNDPFIERVYIERYPGILPDLLPRAVLAEFDRYNFDHIDYFQNERFKIKASIFHDYKIVDVRLALIAEDGQRVIENKAREEDSFILAPTWEIKASDLGAFRDINQYFKVEISATAEAGHSGGNAHLENTLYNLYWCPQADYPFFNVGADNYNPLIETIIVQAGSAFPLITFDDDKIDVIRCAVLSQNDWDAVPGDTDEEKIDSLLANPAGYTYQTANKFDDPKTVEDSRNYTVDISVPSFNGVYKLAAYARDKRFNDEVVKSAPVETKKVFTLNVTNDTPPPCELTQIISITGNGPHRAGRTLTFNMVFNGRVFTAPGYEGTDNTVSVTIQGPDTISTTTGNNRSPDGQPVVIRMTPVANRNNADYVLTGSWTVTENYVFDTVRISAINITGVRRWDQRDDPSVFLNPEDREGIKIDNTALIANFSSKHAIRVMSVKPRIIKINGTDVGTTTEAFPPASYNNDKLTLEFSHAVVPNQGYLTIKPAAGWHIPPVLTNERYTEISNMYTLSSADVSNLTDSTKSSYYIRTTHGLRKNASGAYIDGTPDTSTKYVLNFTSNIDDTTGSVNDLRNILNKARFDWQEFAVNQSAVTNGIISISGNTVTINLDKLPDGRKWKIEIRGPGSNLAGAFADDAGNTFDGWADTTNHTFWSENTAEPVIRVERLSNNDPTQAPVAITANNVNSILPTANRLNTRYRIDCETPGAVIYSGTNTDRVANILGTTETAAGNVTPVEIRTGDGSGMTIRDNTDGSNNRQRFRARDIDGNHNSNLADATLAELNAINIGTTTAYTKNSYQFTPAPSGSLFTARKDYIAARAVRENLNNSVRGYEGAFKTTILVAYFDAVVGRHIGSNPPAGEPSDRTGLRYLKIEGTDQRMGGVKTAGFPLDTHSLIDYGRKGSRFFYRYGSINSEGYLNTDVSNNTGYWIWISWEMVCDFWTLNPTTKEIDGIQTPYKSTTLDDSWQSDRESWAVWTYRKYGNWGLRVNHRNNGTYNTTTGEWSGGTYNGRVSGN